MTAFLTAALVITLLMFTLSFSVAFAQERLLQGWRANILRVRRWAGWLLILVGAWLIVLAVWADVFARFFPV